MCCTDQNLTSLWEWNWNCAYRRFTDLFIQMIGNSSWGFDFSAGFDPYQHSCPTLNVYYWKCAATSLYHSPLSNTLVFIGTTLHVSVIIKNMQMHITKLYQSKPWLWVPNSVCLFCQGLYKWPLVEKFCAMISRSKLFPAVFESFGKWTYGLMKYSYNHILLNFHIYSTFEINMYACIGI